MVLVTTIQLQPLSCSNCKQTLCAAHQAAGRCAPVLLLNQPLTVSRPSLLPEHVLLTFIYMQACSTHACQQHHKAASLSHGWSQKCPCGLACAAIL